MSGFAISPIGATPTLPATDPAGAATSLPAAPDQAGRAAQQFEAILLRQFLAPAVGSIMGGNSLGGSENSSSGTGGGGGGVYSFLLTDVMANAMSKGGGLGLARVLKHQFSHTSEPASAPGPIPLHAADSTPLTPPAGLLP